ncbi:MAG: EAL domain-containing protein [Xanthomonadales bacterium]|nr:EAL domain-containing protein [Xanthomonadales bacterium]
MRRINDYARERKIVTIADGVRREAEAQHCREVGFDLLQGDYIAQPGPLNG